MNRFAAALLLIFVAIPQAPAQAPLPGDWMVSRRTATGYNQIHATPTPNYVLTADANGNPVFVPAGSGTTVQNPNTFFAGPATGAAAVPAFRAIVPADLPPMSSADLRAVITDETGDGELFFKSGNIGRATGERLTLAGNAFVNVTSTDAGGTAIYGRAGTAGVLGESFSNDSIAVSAIASGTGSVALFIESQSPTGALLRARGPGFGHFTLQSELTEDRLWKIPDDAAATNYIASRGWVETGFQPADADLTDLAGLSAAQGDIVIGNAAGDWVKLGKGTASQVLKMNAGATLPEWGAPPAGGVAVGDSPTWTGAHTFSKNGAVSAPTLSLTGTPFTGGTATTTKPLVLIEPTGTTSTGWSTSGTMLGANAASGFFGELIDLQQNGVSRFSVNWAGQVTARSTVLGVNSLAVNPSTASTTLYNVGLLGWAAGSVSHSGENADTAFGRLTARNIRMGLVPSATPLAQTFTIGEASRPGTDSNVAGANGTIQSGLGTGTGTGSQLIFQTPSIVASGSGVQTYTTALTLTNQLASFTRSINAPLGTSTINQIQMDNDSAFIWGTRSRMWSPADGVIRLTNAASNDFSRLQLGGTTSAFPAIKRNAAALNFRLADDSGDAAITAGAATFSGPVTLPQMTKAARNALTAVNGMAVYQTDSTPGLRVYENGAWVRYTATADP